MKLLRAYVATLALLVTLVFSRASLADGSHSCSADFETWLAACASQTGVDFSASRCDAGLAIVRSQADGDQILIELKRKFGQKSFLEVGAFGLSPMGEYADWRQAPKGAQRGLAALSSCVGDDVHGLDTTTAAKVIQPSEMVDWRTPFAYSAIVAWLLFLLISTPRRTRHIDALLGVSAAISVFAFRHLTIEPAFFHQNGQGALWISKALCVPSVYGPGFRSLFHHAAQYGGRHAEQTVFIAQECLGALAVIAVYAIGRGVSLPRLAALATAIAVGIDPLLSRLARSESYYATTLWLLLMAASALVATGQRARRREPLLLAGAAIAGALLSVAMSVHPVSWVPAAFVPAILLMRVGQRRHVLRSLLLSAAVLGAIVAVTALPEVVDVLQGALGKQWGGALDPHSKLFAAALLVLPWVVVWWVPERLQKWVIPVVLLAVGKRIEMSTNLLHGVDIAPGEAWWMLFLVPGFAAALTLIARGLKSPLTRHRHATAAVTSVILVLGISHAAVRWQKWTRLPTDALELRVFGPLLQALPQNASVWTLTGVDKSRQLLPLYRACTGLGPHVQQVTSDVSTIPHGTYWFRSSLCSTPSGKAICDAVEQQHELRPIHVETFPAIPSLLYLPYDTDEIVSGLYHVEAVRPHR